MATKDIHESCDCSSTDSNARLPDQMNVDDFKSMIYNKLERRVSLQFKRRPTLAELSQLSVQTKNFNRKASLINYNYASSPLALRSQMTNKTSSGGGSPGTLSEAPR